MDPFTLAIATFGVQKLRGKSTKRALRDAFIVGGGAYGIGKATSAGYLGGTEGMLGSIGQGEAFSGIKSAIGTPKLTEAKAKEMLAKQGVENASKAQIAAAMEGSGFRGMGTGAKIFTASTLLPFLEGEEEPIKPPFTEKDYKDAYDRQSKKLEGGFEPVTTALPTDTFATNMFYANQGGLATALPQYNEGGINYLPSKSTHSEEDSTNYKRAHGYVEDGSGTGDKDEDTMLAQLADGEFVSRADAVLGAGILSGGDPKSYKSMRKAGADFFYDQQKKFKRIFDLVDASKKTN